jgi:hypothetical protein
VGQERRWYDSEHQLAELKRLWPGQAKRVGSFAHLALLLDLRPVYRKLVQPEVTVVPRYSRLLCVLKKSRL